MSDYDVIIVGGRPSGSTLAARLGQGGLRVLLLERMAFPSLPGVSCPIVYASTLHMLDEIGADEAAYARNTPPIRKMINILDDDIFEFPIPDAYGRDYAYAVDRARFDAALWDHASRQPGVEAITEFSVIDLLWEADQVRGVTGQGADRVTRTFTADVVIGADGRFTTVGRKANAPERDVHEENPTTLYYAYWTNAAPLFDGTPAAVAVGRGEGYGFLMMDSADGSIALAVEGRAELLEAPAGKAREFYLDLLRETPIIWKRVQHAEMIGDVRGMKRIGNLYHAAGGSGWALVGDAYHQKDPLDGQGIYDAVYTSRALAGEILAWKRGEKSWDEALAAYDRAARAETYPMYRSTLERVRTTLYPPELPSWAAALSKRTFTRWLMDDPLFKERLGLMMTRQIHPDFAMTPPIVWGALLRGPLRELSKALEKQIER